MTGIAQVVNSLGWGGLEGVAVRLANAFGETSAGSHILLTSRDTGDLMEKTSAAVSTWRMDRRFAFDPVAVRRMGRYFDEHEIALVHSHNWVSAYLAWSAMGFSRRRPIHLLHDHCGRYEEWRRLLDRIVLRGLDAVVAVAEPVRDRFGEVLRLPRDRCVWLPNGVEVEPPREPFQGRPTVVQVANFKDPKAHDIALRAAARLRTAVPELRWVCVGAQDEDLAYTRRVLSLHRELGLEGCVEMPGGSHDVRKYLREAHVGVLTSDEEGLPLSVLEYMAECLPVTMTRVGQAPVLLDECGGGRTVAPRDPDALAEALQGYLDHPEEARRAGLAGRAMVAEKFSREVMVEGVRSLYEELLRERGQGDLVAALRA